MNRRNFLCASGSCGAHMLALSLFSPLMTRKIFAAQDDDQIVAKEKWGFIQKVNEGIWAQIATPFDSQDFTTVCNSGIIVGKNRVLVVEAFMQPAGAKWMSDQAFKLTGRRPTDVVCTHFHGDHTSGHAGFEHEKSRPNLWLTESTHEAAIKSLNDKNGDSDLQNVQFLNADSPTEIDLGGRKVNIHPRAGHTSSDVTIEVSDPNIVWCGDLFFNRMFPNYGDARPALLNEYADNLNRTPETLYVPGHGPLADAKALSAYKEFLAFVQHSAEAAYKKGQSAADGAKDFKLPESLNEWLVWSPDVAQKGYAAWYRHFEAEKTQDK